ncbi:MAG: hypothetical protein II707_01425, partial [Spirochaetales bacterium]|nr:hypothetical protein [Spirochaetales bacterium]
DGGAACDPEYYWYFGSDIEWKDKNQKDLSTMNVGRRGAEMDEDNNQYYNFSTRNTQKYAVSKDQYVAFTATFDRNQNYTKYLYMEIYEADTSKTYDDYIGKCQIGLSYDKTADKWDVTWGNNKKEVKCGAADMTEVSYGQRSNDGDVTPKFGIKWE